MHEGMCLAAEFATECATMKVHGCISKMLVMKLRNLCNLLTSMFDMNQCALKATHMLLQSSRYHRRF